MVPSDLCCPLAISSVATSGTSLPGSTPRKKQEKFRSKGVKWTLKFKKIYMGMGQNLLIMWFFRDDHQP